VLSAKKQSSFDVASRPPMPCMVNAEDLREFLANKKGPHYRSPAI